MCRELEAVELKVWFLDSLSKFNTSKFNTCDRHVENRVRKYALKKCYLGSDR